MNTIQTGDVIEFDYTNWKGIKGKRSVVVYGFHFGSNEWHPEEQWLLKAFDQEKKDSRMFAMKDMSNVKIVTK